MIKSFHSRDTSIIWEGQKSAKLPNEIQEVARRKMRMLNNSIDLKDLKTPPANRLEKLHGSYKEYYSIRINDQWRIIFKCINGHSYNVEIVDYH
jgi:proteic killer suppression protein